jgi:Peptidase family M28
MTFQPSKKKKNQMLKSLNVFATIECLLLALLLGIANQAGADTLLSADFNIDEGGFNYLDDAFLATAQPNYASGSREANAGFGGSGGLQIILGGIDFNVVTGMSGSWNASFDLPTPATGVSVAFRYKLEIAQGYRFNEFARVLVDIDGRIYGRGSKDYVDHIGGSLPNGSAQPYAPSTNWQKHKVFLGNLAPGRHTIRLGVYSNRKASFASVSTLVIDDVVITDSNLEPAADAAQILVARLGLDQFKANIQTISSFGARDRCCGSASFQNAQAWVAEQLSGMGYATEFHNSSASGGVSNLYVTKIGRSRPDQMYIVSAHLDGRGGGGAADDDGSGVSLVLELARVLAATDVHSEKSIRMIFWDREELPLTGGSGAYVSDRLALQGLEVPAGSGQYPEPTWLGVLHHDMILFDHGVQPISAAQSVFADLDVEWRDGTAKAAESKTLAQVWQNLSGTHASQYPATAYNYSTNTDDRSFHAHVASISIRENRRGSSTEWANPNWHQSTDLYSTYSPADFDLGFNAVQTSAAVIATLAEVIIVAPDSYLKSGFESRIEQEPRQTQVGVLQNTERHSQMIATTPTPPLLRKDLRKALAQRNVWQASAIFDHELWREKYDDRRRSIRSENALQKSLVGRTDRDQRHPD